MTRAVRLISTTLLFFSATMWSAVAFPQDLAISREDCEPGFRRFMRLAEDGQLGPDVINANVGVGDGPIRVELVRAGRAPIVLFLTPKHSAHAISRYFDIEPGENAAAADVARVGKALDECFWEDPYRISGDEVFGPIPGIGEAWAHGGPHGVMRALERRMMVLASLRYTIVVIVGLTIALLANLILLWGSTPPARE